MHARACLLGVVGGVLIYAGLVVFVSLLFYCRMGFARLAEASIRKVKGKGEDEKLTALEKIASSSIGGALATWNQPIEVVRVEVRLSFSFPSSHLNGGLVTRRNIIILGEEKKEEQELINICVF